MKKIALIFAGGTGTRMKKQVPKQFLEIGKKAIIVRTIEVLKNVMILMRYMYHVLKIGLII